MAVTDPVRVYGLDVNGDPVALFMHANGAIDTFLQDQTTALGAIYMLRRLNIVTLASPIAVGDRTVDLGAGHGFSAGDYFGVIDTATGFLWAGLCVGVAVNTITIDTPSGNAFAIASSFASRSTIEMNVDASGGELIYSLVPRGDRAWDIVSCVFSIEGVAAMDTGLFGDQASLTNGVLLRKKRQDGSFANIMVAHNNGDFETLGAYVEYHDRAGGGGTYGFVARFRFGGQSNWGAVPRIDGTKGEELQVVIFDKLDNLTLMRMGVQAHQVD